MRKSRSAHYGVSYLLMCLGMGLQCFFVAGPDLAKAYPGARWIPFAIAAAGQMYAAIRRLMEVEGK